MTAVFLFTTVFYFVCLVVIAICTFLSEYFRLRRQHFIKKIYSGIKQKIPQLYNPMEMNRGTRASHTLHLVGLLLLVASPVAHFLTLPFIVYSHAHLNMCPTEQAIVHFDEFDNKI
jgi:hypothetical protein